MPYADAYTYAPADGYGEPYMYVYYPVYGWTWVVAPWVWGWGPWPFFGPWGSWRFGWYAHGWWRFPDRFHFRQTPFRTPIPGPGIRPGASRASTPAHGVRPGASRGGAHAPRR